MNCTRCLCMVDNLNSSKLRCICSFTITTTRVKESRKFLKGLPIKRHKKSLSTLLRLDLKDSNSTRSIQISNHSNSRSTYLKNGKQYFKDRLLKICKQQKIFITRPTFFDPCINNITFQGIPISLRMINPSKRSTSLLQIF